MFTRPERLTFIYLFILSLISCGEFIGFDDPDQPDLGDINKIKIYLSEDEKNKLYDSLIDDYYAHCTYKEDGRVYDAWLKIRGDLSRVYPKKSFSLKFISGDDEKKYSLDASYRDPSSARNRLAFYAYSEMGLPVPSTEGAALFINDIYIGCYTKIDLYTDKIINTSLELKNSEMYKCKFDDMGSDFPIYYLSEKKIIEDNDFSNLSRLISYAENMTDSDWLDFVNNNFHIELTAKYLFVHSYLAVTDTSKKNFNVAFNGKYALLPWDHEANMRRNYSGSETSSDNYSFEGDNLLMRRLLMEGSPVRDEYIRIFKNEITDHADLLTEKIRSEKDRIYNEIKDAVKYDDNRYSSYDVFEEDMKPGGLIEKFLNEREYEIPLWLKP